MFQRFGFIGILLFVLVFEFYSFTAINIATKSINTKGRIFVLVIYFLLTILLWLFLFYLRKANFSGFPPIIKTLLFALIMGFFVAKIIMATFMLLDEIRRLFSWIFSKFTTTEIKAVVVSSSNGIPRSKFIAQSAILLGGLLIGGFLYGTTNRYKYKIRRLKLKFADLPSSFIGLKIVQISDIHSGSFDNKTAVQHGVDLVLKEQPDLILFTGDLVNNLATEIEPYLEIFSQLKAPMGVYSILGNHDYGDYVTWANEDAKRKNLEDLKAHQAAMGWKLMMNEHVVFERNKEKIALLGIENWSASLRFPKHGDLKKAYSGLENQDIPVKILMSHDPSHWDAEVNKNFKDINLTLSGHTHGMQFGIRIPHFQWSPIQYMYKQWAGLYTKAKQSIYVNVGFGFLGYPGRLGILPEITVIELT